MIFYWFVREGVQFHKSYSLEFSLNTLLISIVSWIIEMSHFEENKNEKRNLDAAQRDQDNPGAAESNPQTNGPAENLREKAAKAEDKSEGSREPA